MTIHLFICVHYIVHTVYLHHVYLHWHSHFFTLRFHCHLDIFVQLFLYQLLPIICVIVHYSATGNVFQVFQSCKQQPSSKSINIMQVQDCAWFWFSIGFLTACYNDNHELRISGTNFSKLGWEGQDSNTDKRDFSLAETVFCSSKTSQLSNATF